VFFFGFFFWIGFVLLYLSGNNMSYDTSVEKIWQWGSLEADPNDPGAVVDTIRRNIASFEQEYLKFGLYYTLEMAMYDLKANQRYSVKSPSRIRRKSHGDLETYHSLRTSKRIRSSDQLHLGYGKDTAAALSNRNKLEYGTSTSPLGYIPLSVEDHEIRLLQVLPSFNFSADIHCLLMNRSLFDKDLIYHPISYVWGDPKVTEEITVNGVRIAVRYNLATALREFRRQGYNLLWVDALCIDQTNIAERSREVLRMAEIYNTPTRTLVWLGEETENTNAAYNLLVRLIDYCKVPFVDKKGARRIDLDYITVFPWIHPLSEIDEWRKGIEGVIDLFSRPYWYRVWTFQELVLARAIVVHCGRNELPWSAICGGIAAISALPDHNPLAEQDTMSENLRIGLQHVVQESTRGLVAELNDSNIVREMKLAVRGADARRVARENVQSEESRDLLVVRQENALSLYFAV